MQLKTPMHCVSGNFRPDGDVYANLEYDAAAAHAILAALDRSIDIGLSSDARLIIDAYRRALMNSANDLMWKWGYH